MSMEFHRIITLLRKERGYTQKKVAEDLKISQALLSHYEKGIRECGLEFVVRVANYYEVSCDYLLGRSEQRNGLVISAEEIPNPEKMKDNIFKGSVLPTMNKKLISNSLNVLYAKISDCKNKALVKETSDYLMLAVYKTFRMLYNAEPRNAKSLFSVPDCIWEGYSSCAMSMTEANIKAILSGTAPATLADANDVDIECLKMTTQSLAEEYPLYAPSLLNLIKNSETRIESFK